MISARSGGIVSVRMLVPPVVLRREMDRLLVEFFYRNRAAQFRRAIVDFCRYYSVRPPRIEWYEYIDWGKAAGKTFDDGRIHLVHPENWQRGRVYKSERMWVQTVYHELAHYLFWTDAERKAEAFTCRMVRGLRRRTRRAVAMNRRASTIRRSAGARRRKSVGTGSATGAKRNEVRSPRTRLPSSRANGRRTAGLSRRRRAA
jgi:hypothetical protein